MRIFVTGATGFIGSAIVKELLGAGHQVLGLARSDASAASLVEAGAQAHRGSLDDFDSLKSGAESCDGVIHTAFVHDFSAYASAGETDRRAVEALGAGLEGTDRPFVITSGITVLAQGRLATEEGQPDLAAASAIRIPSEQAVLAMAGRGVRASVIRLPPSVHGEGDHAFVPALIDIARKTGVSAFVGDGSNRWPAVHRLDAVQLYLLAMERAPAGSILHAVADGGVPMRDIASVIGQRLSLPVVSKSPDEAAEHFGWLAQFVALDAPASSDLTRERMGWSPTQPGLLQDLDSDKYFATSA